MGFSWDNIGKVAFGSPGTRMPGKYSPGDVRRKSKRYTDEAIDRSPAMTGMKAGLKGYTAPEEEAIFERGRARTSSAQRGGMRELSKALSKSGIAGGLAGNFMSNLAGDYGKQFGEQGRDLELSNIAEKQKRLKDYFDMEKSMMGYGTGLAQAEEGGDRYAYEQEMRRKAMFGEDPSGGILGAVAERYAPGFGGNIYKQLFQSRA